MSAWVAVAGVGLGSLAFRMVPLVVLGRLHLSPRVESLIARAGLAAIVALIAISTRGAAQGEARWPTVAAVGVAIVLSVRRYGMLPIVVTGGAIYTLLRLGAAL